MPYFIYMYPNYLNILYKKNPEQNQTPKKKKYNGGCKLENNIFTYTIAMKLLMINTIK
jgi:hypothetical protein